jgi:hypothetical protein
MTNERDRVSCARGSAVWTPGRSQEGEIAADQLVSGALAIGPAIGGAVLAYSPNAVWWGGALVAGVIGVGALLAGDRIPDKPLAATESKAPPGNPMPEAA